jgi:hypothetical protein
MSDLTKEALLKRYRTEKSFPDKDCIKLGRLKAELKYRFKMTDSEIEGGGMEDLLKDVMSGGVFK